MLYRLDDGGAQSVRRHACAGICHVPQPVRHRLYGAVAVCAQGLSGIKTKRLGLYAIRGSGAYFVTLVLLYSAAALIPLADLTSITFTRPILGTIAAIIFLKEVAGARRWTAIGVGFVGMLIIVRPGLVEVNLRRAAGALRRDVPDLQHGDRQETDRDGAPRYHRALSHALFILPLARSSRRSMSGRHQRLEQWGWFAVIGGAGILTQRAMTRAFVAADATCRLGDELSAPANRGLCRVRDLWRGPGDLGLGWRQRHLWVVSLYRAS